MASKGFFSRLWDLFRSFFGTHLDHAEAGNAELVYRRALAEHVARHREFKEAVAHLVYLRNKSEDAARSAKADCRVIHEALDIAVQGDQDDNAIGLMQKLRAAEAIVTRFDKDFVRLSAQAQLAKAGLAELATAIKGLQNEEAEMLARRAHAQARLHVAAVVERSRGGVGSDPALDNVREAISRLEQLAEVDGPEGSDAHDPLSIDSLRGEAHARGDRIRLAEMKRQLGKNLLLAPVVVAETTAIRPQPVEARP